MIRRLLVGLAALLLPWASEARGDWRAELESIAGRDGIIVVADSDGRRIVDIHGDRSFVPASTLKVVTAWGALEALGADYRFETRFLRSPSDQLVVQGGGDPMLVSEELAIIAARLAKLAPPQGFRGLVLDDGRFAPDIAIPGISRSTNPYDARNGGLAANFNTIQVARKDGRIVSAEAQTPLTPLAIRIAEQRGVQAKARVNLGRDRETTLRYVGELLAAFLAREGVEVSGEIRLGRASADARAIYVHSQSRSLETILAGFLEFSNNFSANQVLLAMGLEKSAPPATLAKGIAALEAELARAGIAQGLRIDEGSGISRANRATAAQLLEVLAAFSPHRSLLPEKHGFRHKTGSLNGIRTLVAYVDHPTRGELRCVLSLAGHQGAARFRVLELIAGAPLPPRG